MDKGSAGYFFCIFAVILCVNLPFIVCDLVFAGRNNACVTTMGTNIGLTIGTWLQVDGYCKVAIVALFFLVALAGCCNPDTAIKMFACTLCFILIYSLFNFAWLIVGAVLFWGDINEKGLCGGTEVQGYMYAVLILGFIGVCSSSFSSYKQRQ